MSNIFFSLYLLFVVSWFTHLASRISVLGIVRFDLILVLVLIFLAVFLPKVEEEERDKSEEGSNTINESNDSSKTIGNYLKIIFVYSILTIPFVEWPGSVLNHGLIQFLKAVVFYFFTIKFVTTEKQLKIFMAVFLCTQTFRVLEPLYLHVTTGYWGSATYMGQAEFMQRLSGAPNDIVNPNGLAFVIVSIIPFYFYYAELNKKVRFVLLFLMPAFIWTLVLTASRSGFVALCAIIGLIVLKSRHKLFLVVILAIGLMLAVPFLSENQKDRYLSLVSKDTKNSATATGRIEGVSNSFQVALRKPIFGHGLGTSAEANWNFAHSKHLAHNLYAEIAQELGFVGLFIFILYIIAIFKELKIEQRRWRHLAVLQPNFLQASWSALQVFFYMNLLFSLASYGLSLYQWYLMPGMVVVLARIQQDCIDKEKLDGNKAK